MDAISDTTPAMIDKETLRSTFAAVPTPVSIVTVGNGEKRYGATVGTLISLSLEPPLIGFSLKKGSGLLARLDPGIHFGITVLSAGQEQAALDFAKNERDRFERTPWCEERGVPRIDNGLAWFAGHVVARHEAGDHEIVVGLVNLAERSSRQALLFAERCFHDFHLQPANREQTEGATHPLQA